MTITGERRLDHDYGADDQGRGEEGATWRGKEVPRRLRSLGLANTDSNMFTVGMMWSGTGAWKFSKLSQVTDGRPAGSSEEAPTASESHADAT